MEKQKLRLMRVKRKHILARLLLSLAAVVILLPVVLTALFWKRSNKYGALAGMITGGVMIFVWKFAISKLGGVFAIYELLPAFLCALIAIVVVSLLTKAPEQEIVDEFEAVSAEMKQK